jgi:hypothetical protein
MLESQGASLKADARLRVEIRAWSRCLTMLEVTSSIPSTEKFLEI